MITPSPKKMLLSNHAIVSLGILTRRAKHTIGEFKASEVLNNHQQAYRLLFQSILYGDEALVSLTTELNKTLQIEPNLIQALATYLAHLKHDEKNDVAITKHKEALNAFSQHLYDIEVDHSAYRKAAEDFLASATKAEQAFYLNVVRHFYPYWEGSHRVLLETNKQKSIESSQEKQTLMELWEKLDDAFVTSIEESLLTKYTHAIRSIHIPPKQIELRAKIAKLILIKQRPFKGTASGYRENIKLIEANLTTDDLHAYFLSVSREFYNIWVDAQLQHSEPAS